MKSDEVAMLCLLPPAGVSLEHVCLGLPIPGGVVYTTSPQTEGECSYMHILSMGIYLSRGPLTQSTFFTAACHFFQHLHHVHVIT